MASTKGPTEARPLRERNSPDTHAVGSNAPALERAQSWGAKPCDPTPEQGGKKPGYGTETSAHDLPLNPIVAHCWLCAMTFVWLRRGDVGGWAAARGEKKGVSH